MVVGGGPSMSDPYTTGAYAEANPDWHAADAAHKAEALAQMIRAVGLRPGAVVDVGCGTGGVLASLSHTLGSELPDTRWEGWDIAPEAVRRAQHDHPHLEFVCGDVRVSEVQADLMICVDTFEHVGDDEAFLSALRLRAPWHLFRIPLDLCAIDVVRPDRLRDRVQRLGHRHLYTRELALGLLQRAGYAIEGERYHRIGPVDPGVRGRVLDRVRRGLYRGAPHLTVRWLGGWSLVVCCRAQALR